MGTTKVRLFVAMLVAVGIWVTATVSMRWYDHPIRRASRISGISLPHESRVLFAENTYAGFVEDGYSLYVLDVPRGVTPTSPDECARIDYRFGSLQELDLHLLATEKYIDRRGVGCYRSSGNYADWTLVILQGNRVVIETVTS